MGRVESIGDRIAIYRKRRGLSQARLGAMIGRTADYVSKLERGERAVDRVSRLVPVAEALEIPLSELTGEAPAVLRRQDEQLRATRAVRLALTGHQFLQALVDSERAGRRSDQPLDALRTEVANAWELVHGSEFAALGELLPRLIPSIELAAREISASDKHDAFRLLSDVYQVTAAFMAQLGETELAWVAAERAVFAAERADAPLLALAGDFRLGHAFLAGGRLDQAERVANAAAVGLRSSLDDGRDPEALSLFGGVRLVAAVAAARQNHADDAERALSEANEAAKALGADGNEYGTEFGPTNVALHRVHVAVELGRPGTALQLAREVDPSLLSPERRGRLLVDVARAHAQRGEVAEAVDAFEQAERITPELVRHHPIVREVIEGLVKRTRTKPNRALLRLAARVVQVR